MILRNDIFHWFYTQRHKAKISKDVIPFNSISMHMLFSLSLYLYLC